MNANQAARSMSFDKYRQWWYKQLSERPPEPINEEWTVGQVRDERLIRQGYNYRNGLPLDTNHEEPSLCAT
jgi:hypothetical protein